MENSWWLGIDKRPPVSTRYQAMGNVLLCKMEPWIFARPVLRIVISWSFSSRIMFPHSQQRPSVIHIGLQLPIIRGIERKWWNFRKANWDSFTDATERSIALIPVNHISVEEMYRRFCGALQKAAKNQEFTDLWISCILTTVNKDDDDDDDIRICRHWWQDCQVICLM